MLDPAGIGKVSFIDSFTYYFISIAEFGIVVYGMREIARLKNDPEKRSKLVSELLTLHLLSSFITLLLYLVSVYFIWNKIDDIRLLLFSLSFLLVNFFACEWYFLGMEQFKFITMRSLITRGLGLLSIFVLITNPDDYYIYYAIIAGSAIVTSLWNNYLLFSELKIRFTKVNWKKHVPHTMITYSISLVYGVTLMLDTVFLGLISSATVVGWYAFSMKIVRISTGVLTDTLLVFFPRIVFLLQEKNYSEVQILISKNLQLIILFSLPLGAGLFLLSGELVTVFLGAQFIPAADNLKILAFYPLIKAYNLFLSKQILISHNKEILYLKSLVAGSLIFVVLTFILSSRLADQGACYAILAGEFSILLFNLYYVKRIAPMLQVFQWKSFFQGLTGAILFIPIIFLLKLSGFSETVFLISSVIICFMTYMLFQTYIIKNSFMLLLKQAVKKKGFN